MHVCRHRKYFSVSEEYISKYSDAVACGVHQVEAILDKKHYKKRDTSYSGSDSEVLDVSLLALHNGPTGITSSINHTIYV